MIKNLEINKAKNVPLFCFIKWELPTAAAAKDFLKAAVEQLQTATKCVFKDTLHYSQFTLEGTKDNQLDLLFGLGIKADNFQRVLRQVILMTQDNKDIRNGSVGIASQAKESQGGEATTNAGGSEEVSGETIQEGEGLHNTLTSEKDTECYTVSSPNGAVDGEVD